MGLALLQDAVHLGFDQLADGRQPLLRRSFGPVSQGHAMKRRYETVRPFHMLGLILQQSGAGLIVQPLH